MNALYWTGQYDRAIETLRTLLQGSPDNAVLHHELHRGYAAKGMYRESAQELEKTIATAGLPEAAARVHHAFVVSGYQGAMRQWAKELEHLMAAHQWYFPVILAETYVTIGDKERAFYWLEEAFKNRDVHQTSHDLDLPWINPEPTFGPLRSDPRFKDLLHRMRLPP